MPDVARVKDLVDSLRSSPKSFRHQGLDFQITDFGISEKGGAVADVQVSNRGEIYFDDRIIIDKPPLWTPNIRLPVMPPATEDNPHVGDIADTIEAFKAVVLNTAIRHTNNFTIKRIERLGKSDIFAGDIVLVVASAATDGDIDSDGSDTQATIRAGGATLTADTTLTNCFVLYHNDAIPDEIVITILFLSFDASAVVDTSTIASHRFLVYGAGIALDGILTTGTVEIKATTDWGTVTSADWIDFTTSTNWTNKVTLGTRAVSGFDTTSNVENICAGQNSASISKTGVTYTVWATDRSYTGANLAEDTSEGIVFRGPDTAGTSTDPTLELLVDPRRNTPVIVRQATMRSAIR